MQLESQKTLREVVLGLVPTLNIYISITDYFRQAQLKDDLESKLRKEFESEAGELRQAQEELRVQVLP